MPPELAHTNNDGALLPATVLALVDAGFEQMVTEGVVYHAEPDGHEPAELVDAEFTAQGLHVAVDDPHRLARIFLASECHHCERHTLVHQAGQFLRWDGACYREAADIEKQVIASIRAEFERLNRADVAAAAAGAATVPTVRKVYTPLVRNVMQALASIVAIPAEQRLPSWLGEETCPARDVLACQNGLLLLPALVAETQIGDCLIPPTPRFFSRSVLPFALDPEAPVPERWLQFLAQLWPNDPDAIVCLQDWFGYCLTCETRQQKILLLVGPTRSGKGTIARVQSALLGTENVANPTLASLATNFGLAPLIGKTLAIIPDARLSGRTDQAPIVERLLSISGEDGMTIDRKHRPAWNGQLIARLMLLTNELPRLRDASGALAGRLLVLPLTRSFLGMEDVHLTDALREELPGILTWAIEGYLRLRQRGHFEPPASGSPLVEQLTELASPVAQFISERCTIGPDMRVPVETLYDRFREWCGEQGKEFIPDKALFGRDLRAVVPTVTNSPIRRCGVQTRWYRGIALHGAGCF